MEKKGHWILGFICCAAFVMLLGWMNLHIFEISVSSMVVMLGIVLLYSILPDIDHKNSTMTWIFIGVATVGVLVGIFQLVFGFGNPNSVLFSSALLLVSIFVSANFLEHRGIVHSIPAGIILALPLWLLFNSIGYFLLGYVAWHSHLIGDGLWFKLR